MFLYNICVRAFFCVAKQVRIVSTSILSVVLVDPLWEIYTKAPEIVGGWGGTKWSDICAAITHVPADHWQDIGYFECNALIERKFNSHMISLFSLSKLCTVCIVIYDIFRITRLRIYQLMTNQYKISNSI